MIGFCDLEPRSSNVEIYYVLRLFLRAWHSQVKTQWSCFSCLLPSAKKVTVGYCFHRRLAMGGWGGGVTSSAIWDRPNSRVPLRSGGIFPEHKTGITGTSSYLLRYGTSCDGH